MAGSLRFPSPLPDAARYLFEPDQASNNKRLIMRDFRAWSRSLHHAEANSNRARVCSASKKMTEAPDKRASGHDD
jgi:hypothetical protein